MSKKNIILCITPNMDVYKREIGDFAIGKDHKIVRGEFIIQGRRYMPISQKYKARGFHGVEVIELPLAYKLKDYYEIKQECLLAEME